MASPDFGDASSIPRQVSVATENNVIPRRAILPHLARRNSALVRKVAIGGRIVAEDLH